MAKIKGVVTQFGTKGYGFIDGDDGEKYFVHQKNIFNKSRLKNDTRVVFNTQTSEKGLVAIDVNLERGGGLAEPLSGGVVKILFAVLFISQFVLIYKAFFQ